MISDVSINVWLNVRWCPVAPRSVCSVDCVTGSDVVGDFVHTLQIHCENDTQFKQNSLLVSVTDTPLRLSHILPKEINVYASLNRYLRLNSPSACKKLRLTF
jgi:hypothetical protein